MPTRIFQVILVILLLAALIFFSGFYPVAFVGRRVILASDFYTNLAAAKKFYESQKVSYGAGEVAWTDEKFLDLEENIKSAVLQNLIEDKILVSRPGEIPDVKSRLNENLNRILGQVSADLTNEGLANLYGWDVRTFKKRVLQPEARRKTFVEGFARQGRDFNEWFNGEKQGAKVKILLRGFAWNQNRGQVEAHQ